MNKSMYLFATALVAGTLGMTSCTSEEFVDGAGSGTENTVTLSMSVADKFGTRSTANEVNLGGSANLQTISNVTVVPMRGASSLNPIVLGDLNPADGNRKVEKKTPLNSLVDAFKVYGNVPAENFDATKVFEGFTISTTTSTSAGTIKGFNSETLYEPHKLYYYGYAKASTSDPSIYVGEDFDGATTALTDGQTIGNNKYVKVTGVNYAVGVLAAAVLSGDKETKIYTKGGDGSYSESSEFVENVVTLKGIFFDNQKQSFNEDFETSGADISVYSEAAASTLASSKISFSSSDKTIAGANFYVIANATTTATEDWVKGNFVFTLPANKYIKVGTGNTDADFIGGDSETLFYIAFKMEPKESQAVFQKDHTTIINATVKKWGLASDEPVEVTDVTLGVVIDMDWQEGLSYDVEI